MSNLVTRDSLTALVSRDDIAAQVIGRALVALFNRQTSSEQTANTTNRDNDVGFTHADARSGSLTAKYFLKHKTLLEWQIDRWRKPQKNGFPRLAKYWRQLDDIARQKATK